MALYVDCAYVDEVAAICATYPVAGVTTNPTLWLAAIERGQRLDDVALVRELLRVCTGLVFAQPSGADATALANAALRYAALDSARVVIKLPANTAGVAAAAQLQLAAVRFAFTAVYSRAQAYAGALAGAEWLIPYFGRLRRAGLDPCAVIRDLRGIAGGEALPASARILAASLKSPDDVAEAVLAGASDLTAPPDCIRALPEDPLSLGDITQFDQDAQRARQLLGG
ncbi:MAG: transaldolase family protein [Ktedonobacterales bacterium]